MVTKKNMRTGLQPALMMSFIIMGATGLLMMFHLRIGGIKNLHEWVSVVFLVLCAIHLALNWKVFLVQFKNGPVAISAALIFLLSAILMFGGGGGSHTGQSDTGHYSHTYKKN